MPANPATIWSEAQDALLKSAHDEGLSFSLIAEFINRTTGSRFSRNSAIGRAHRIKLPSRKQETKPKTHKPRTQYQNRGWFRAGPPLPVEPIPEPPAPELPFLNIALFDLEKQHCRFPSRHDDPSEIRFCGQPKEDANLSSYCAFHRRVCNDRPRTQISSRKFQCTT